MAEWRYLGKQIEAAEASGSFHDCPDESAPHFLPPFPPCRRQIVSTVLGDPALKALWLEEVRATGPLPPYVTPV